MEIDLNTDSKESLNLNDSHSSKPIRKKRSAKSYALELLIKVLLTILVVWILFTYVIGIFVNHSNSAYPMVKDGDLCITYRLQELKQGDAIVYSLDGSTKYGRVIAFEGDIVEIKDDYITVNGYGIFEDAVYPTSSDGSLITYPYTVPEGCVFVLNDFRSDISDSRTYGGIPIDDTQGKIIFLMRRRGI